MKRAFITGVSGQTGSYLAELLLEKGYAVHGLVRRTSNGAPGRIAHIADRLTLHEGDLLDQHSLVAALEAAEPDEVYNLAAQSFVGTSWQQPDYTCEVTGLGVLRLLEAVRSVVPHARFYQASSSEMFGKVLETPQRETTPFHPRSPYGCAKVFAHHLTVNYRESYGLWACCGICFNHESPRRGEEFVTRKITRAVGRIKRGEQRTLKLGNLDAKRDWGFAGDYAEAMWRMLQNDEPRDYVIGTGETHTVREFVDEAFKVAGNDLFMGMAWQDHVECDPNLYRPAEVDLLLADRSKIRNELCWRPSVDFYQLVRMMVEADL